MVRDLAIMASEMSRWVTRRMVLGPKAEALMPLAASCWSIESAVWGGVRSKMTMLDWTGRTDETQGRLLRHWPRRRAW